MPLPYDGGHSPSPSLVGPRAGIMVGRYRLEGLLGQGAMATVWRATDTALGRQVAIKLLSPGIAARPDSGARFQREARALAALAHPGILRVHDFVPGGGGEPGYLVEELIEGRTVGWWLQSRRGLLPEVAAAIGVGVARALAAAHSRGVIHRDVKPDNVMLEPTGDRARVVLTDFGVAHVSGLETMTATGALLGSPAYMAPEQARGHEVGPAADLWGLGVLLYEMATGALPFTGPDPFAVIAAIARGGFARPSQIEPRVGAGLEAVIMRCLRSNPEQRPRHADEVADALEKAAAESGLPADGTLIRRFMDGPVALDEQIAPVVAERACARAREHIRKRELARALAEIGRAQAYVDHHAGAAALLASLSAQRRWRRAAATAAAVGGLAAATAFGIPAWRGYRARIATPSARGEAGHAHRKVLVRAAEAAPVHAANVTTTQLVASMAELGLPPQLAPPASSTTGRPKKRAGNVSQRSPRPVTATASFLPVAVTPAPEPVDGERLRPAETSSRAEMPPARGLGSVVLSSARAFCYPSLDDHPVTSVNPRYVNVPAGTHQVWCSLSPRGDRQLVGVIEVLEGRVSRRVIVSDAGTKHPTFARLGSEPDGLATSPRH